jgi:uncharacterized membrane protein (UPF0136 family)
MYTPKRRSPCRPLSAEPAVRGGGGGAIDQLKEEGMEDKRVPQYAVFEDYRPTVSVAVLIRWVLLGAWFFILHYRSEYDRTWMYLQALGAGLAALNAYVTWRIATRRPITWHYAVILSVSDLAVLTAAMFLMGGFQNPYYPFYYPALLGLSLLSPAGATVVATSLVIGLYVSMAFIVSPTLI